VLDTAGNVIVLVLMVGGAVVMWWLVGRLWSIDGRSLHNDVTGWQISVLGTTYAVILGFMLFASWADFRTADQNADVEASCLINLFWSASGLPDAQRDELRRLAADYADTMINDEWPAMAHDTFSHQASEIVHRMWETAASPQTLTASQQVSLEQTMGEIGHITEHRRVRQLQSEATLPAILWIVLIVGAGVTLLSACLFGSAKPLLHLLQVVALALLLSLSLIAVADVNRPFRGVVHVQPTGFANAKRIFDRYGPSSAAH
jgi:hypothetical protein